MACFIVPAAEAVVTTVAAKILASKEKEGKFVSIHTGNGIETAEKISFSRKLNWLSKLLWGGSALLCYEHLWHGEVVPFSPFLTAASDPGSAAVMLKEMAIVGGTMSLFMTGVWCLMLLAAAGIQKKALKARAVTK